MVYIEFNSQFVACSSVAIPLKIETYAWWFLISNSIIFFEKSKKIYQTSEDELGIAYPISNLGEFCKHPYCFTLGNR